jgi:nitronate monooxygenase
VAHSIRTPVCELLGIDVPILSVGFGFPAGPELVAAVSGAGGLGVLGGSGVPPAETSHRIARTHELTDRPFGLNLIIADLEDPNAPAEDIAYINDQADAGLAAGIALLVLFWGPARSFVQRAHERGARVALQVGSVDEARAAAADGVDIVIAQGIEAGGHVRGTTSIWTLLPAVVEAVGSVPVLASGGIGDGAGIARALGLGAQGVSLGTRFVASEEAGVHDAFKRRILAARAEDTVYGTIFDVWWPDAPHRVLRNRVVEEWEAAGRPASGHRPGEGTTIGTMHRPWGDTAWPRYATGMVAADFDGDPELAPMWAGESAGLVHEVEPAATIVARLVRDAEAAVR